MPHLVESRHLMPHDVISFGALVARGADGGRLSRRRSCGRHLRLRVLIRVTMSITTRAIRACPLFHQGLGMVCSDRESEKGLREIVQFPHTEPSIAAPSVELEDDRQSLEEAHAHLRREGRQDLEKACAGAEGMVELLVPFGRRRASECPLHRREETSLIDCLAKAREGVTPREGGGGGRKDGIRRGGSRWSDTSLCGIRRPLIGNLINDLADLADEVRSQEIIPPQSEDVAEGLPPPKARGRARYRALLALGPRGAPCGRHLGGRQLKCHHISHERLWLTVACLACLNQRRVCRQPTIILAVVRLGEAVEHLANAAAQ
mmetsp:Transcript_8541/g.22332  ORF Transcript_8541/g.22332 Transcript_8541/m.22332 type:complete len:319 (-) Transcript_8541:186-1142(-)